MTLSKSMILKFASIAALTVNLSAGQLGPTNVQTIVDKLPITSTQHYFVNKTMMQPIQECHAVNVQTSNGEKMNPTGYDIAGGAVGGILGSLVGGGTGKVAATIGGAIAGTMITDHAVNEHNDNIKQTVSEEQVCQTKMTNIQVQIPHTKYLAKDIKNGGTYEIDVDESVQKGVPKSIEVKRVIKTEVVDVQPGYF
jgi:outer membrane lipoprotein SlyB